MKTLFRDLPVAWLQLSHGKTKLLAAVIGIVFADLLMWMQLGFLSAAVESAVYVHGRLCGDLVILNPLSEQISAAKQFPRRHLVRAQAHPDVEAVAPLYTGLVEWRDPGTGDKRMVFAYGLVPYAPAIRADGVLESAQALYPTDTCLFDVQSRKEFGSVVQRLQSGEPVEAEVNGRRLTVVGTTAIGASFTADGNLVVSDANFFRLMPKRAPGAIDVGVVRLRPGADPHQVKAELQTMLGPDLRVLTIDEFREREKDYMLRTRPINFIFTMGAAVGFLVGFAIVYQILFTDVNNHLPQYATLKAIGYSDFYLQAIVLQESFILSVLGYLPGVVLSWGLYAITVKATNLPMHLTWTRGATIFALTVLMCSLSALLAMRKLRQADPADVF